MEVHNPYASLQNHFTSWQRRETAPSASLFPTAPRGWSDGEGSARPLQLHPHPVDSEMVGSERQLSKSSGDEDVSLQRKHRQATQSGYESVPELVLNLPSSNCHPLESPPSVFFPQFQGYLQCHSG